MQKTQPEVRILKYERYIIHGMPIFFISDLHLDEAHPDISASFIQFLEEEAPSADALYILGDLFEVWIGDDENTALQKNIQKKLRHLSEKIPVYFIAGNRDFLLGKTFAKKAGLTLLKDPTLIYLYGRSALIMHGDTLCTEDKKYQAFRRKARNRLYQKLFLILPLFIRQKIAVKMRALSRQHTSQTKTQIMDVTQAEVERVMNLYQTDLLIHGHTHRPGIHTEKKGERIVLGAWHDGVSVLKYRENHHKELK